MNEITEHIDVFPTIETGETQPFERTFTFEEYLEFELSADEKHEFRNGKLHLMPDVTAVHCNINARVGTFINQALDLKGDETTHVYGPSMKIYIIDKNKTVYPDVTVVQGEPIDIDVSGENSVLINPILIVEVLDLTENYDRSEKFADYRTLNSLREYVLVSQDEPKVEVFFLQNPDENLWKISVYEGFDAVVELRSIGCEIKMKQIYHRIFK